MDLKLPLTRAVDDDNLSFPVMEFPVVEVQSDRVFKVGDVDSNVLITLVRARTEIWERRLPKHANQPFAQRAWEEISEIMGIPAHVLRRKWKNLRDCFGVELSKPFESKWAYFESLSFLKGFVKPRGKVHPIPPPKDPLAIDPLDEAPLMLNEDDTFLIVEHEEKFDPSKFGFFAIAPISPSEQTSSIRIVSDCEPATKKARNDMIQRFNDDDHEPELNDTSHTDLEASSSDFNQNSNQTVACQANESDIRNSDLSNSDHNLNSNGPINSSLEMKNDSKAYLDDSNLNRKARVFVENNPEVYANNTDRTMKSLKLNSCKVCSNQVDFNPKDPASRICSNCGKFFSGLLKPSNVEDPQARSNIHSTTRSTNQYQANMAAIDLTEDDATEDEDFFRSILPHVRKIPPHLKLRFRNRMHDLVEEFAYPQIKISSTPGHT